MAAGINLGALVYDLILDKGSWDGDIDKAKLDVQSVEKAFKETGQNISKAGTFLTMGITLPLAGVATAAVKTGMDFDSQMSRVQAIAGATGDEFDALREQALLLGAETSFSASSAAQGMENLASAGFTTNEIVAAMPGLLDMAAASGADLGVASEIAASILRGFGMDASDAGHIADVLAEASARTNAQVEDMGEAMKYVAPVANAMGISMEETAAAVGLLSDAGIKGSQAGTTLRGALARMTKPTKAMQEVMDELNLSFYDSEGRMKGISEIVTMLQGSFNGLTEEEQQHATTVLFGQEAMSGMLALIEAGPEKLESLTQGLIESDGAAKNMATTMLDNLGGAVEELTGSLETAGIGLYDLGKEQITNAVKSITDLVNSFNSLDEGAKRQIISLAGAAAAMGPLLIGTGKITSGLGGLLPVFSSVRGGLGNLVGSMGSTASGLLDNVSKATGFNNVLDGVKTKLGTALGPMKGFASNLAPLKNLMGPINSGFGMFGKIVGGIFGAGGIVAIALTLLTVFAAGASAAGVDVQNIITNVVNGVTQFATSFAEKFRELAPKVLEAMPGMLKAITDGIITMLDVLIPIGMEMIIMLIQGLAANLPQIITSAIDIVLKLVDELIKAAPMLLDAAIQLIIGIVEGLIQNVDRVVAAALEIMKVLIDALIKNLPIIIEKLPDIIMAIVNALIEAAPVILQAGVEIVVALAKGLIQAIPKLWEAAVELGKNLLDKIKSIFGINSPSTVLTDIGKNIVQGLINGIMGLLGNVGTAISNVAGSIRDGISGAVNMAREWGGNLIGKLSEGINNAKQFASTAISGIGSAISTGVTGVVDKARTWGGNLIENISSGISNAGSRISTTVSGIGSVISGGVASVVDVARSWGGNLVGNISNGIANAKDRVSNAISGIGGSIGTSVSGILNNAKSWGSDMMSGLANGISAAKNKVADAAKSVAERIKNFLHFTRPDEGPLREYEKWMPDMIDGMALGINRKMGTVVNAARQLSSEIAENMTTNFTVGAAADMQSSMAMPMGQPRMAQNAAGRAGGYNDASLLSDAVKQGIKDGIKEAGDRQGEIVVNVYEDGILKRTIREGRRANQRAGKPVLQVG